jgi:hypothetical protein
LDEAKEQAKTAKKIIKSQAKALKKRAVEPGCAEDAGGQSAVPKARPSSGVGAVRAGFGETLWHCHRLA